MIGTQMLGLGVMKEFGYVEAFWFSPEETSMFGWVGSCHENLTLRLSSGDIGEGQRKRRFGWIMIMDGLSDNLVRSSVFLIFYF